MGLVVGPTDHGKTVHPDTCAVCKGPLGTLTHGTGVTTSERQGVVTCRLSMRTVCGAFVTAEPK